MPPHLPERSSLCRSIFFFSRSAQLQPPHDASEHARAPLLTASVLLESRASQDDSPILQEDCWEVISAYFEEKGLVRQQLDSFDEFIMNTMQEIVDECAQLKLDPQQQHNPLMQTASGKSYTITFGQIYLSKPTWVESDRTTSAMFPNEAPRRCIWT